MKVRTVLLILLALLAAVAAFALPLFVKIACATPEPSRSMSISTGAALKAFVVKTPAALAAHLENIKERSFRASSFIPT